MTNQATIKRAAVTYSLAEKALVGATEYQVKHGNKTIARYADHAAAKAHFNRLFYGNQEQTSGLVVLADENRWYIVENIDYQDAEGNWGMSSKVHGKSDGYDTYHLAHVAMIALPTYSPPT